MVSDKPHHLVRLSAYLSPNRHRASETKSIASPMSREQRALPFTACGLLGDIGKGEQPPPVRRADEADDGGRCRGREVVSLR
jgi:hypothetical protein